ncbi:MAG: hypothetical protein ACM3VS_12005 [Candidatus Dadabacteria bacterium]
MRKPMKYKFLLFTIIILLLLFVVNSAEAQCSICTRTAQQLGEKPARGLNAGILYLAFTPLAIIGVLALKMLRKDDVAKKD